MRQHATVRAARLNALLASQPSDQIVTTQTPIAPQPVIVRLAGQQIEADLVSEYVNSAKLGVIQAQKYLLTRLNGRQLRLGQFAAGVTDLPLTNSDLIQKVYTGSDPGDVIKPYLHDLKSRRWHDSRIRLLFFVISDVPYNLTDGTTGGEAIDDELFGLFLGGGGTIAGDNNGVATKQLSVAQLIIHEWVHTNGGDNGRDMDPNDPGHSVNPADIMYWSARAGKPSRQLDVDHSYVDLGYIALATPAGTYDVGASPYLATKHDATFQRTLTTTPAEWGRVKTCPHPIRNGVTVQLFDRGAIVQRGNERPIAVTEFIFDKWWSVARTSPNFLPVDRAREMMAKWCNISLATQLLLDQY